MTPSALMPNWMMGAEFTSKVTTAGGVVRFTGRFLAAWLTLAATWLASAFLSVFESKFKTTRLVPVELVELMSVIPWTVDTAFSMTWVTCWSMTVGSARCSWSARRPPEC